MSETKKNVGRPSLFTAELADIICERLADGESLRSICDDDAMPAKSTVFKWLSQDETFADQYARAREAQADSLADDILPIADDSRNDWLKKWGEEDENAGWVQNAEAMRRAQIRIDARKWLAGKMAPKKYGDATMLKHADADGQKLTPILNVTLGSTTRSEPAS